jgi:hypothetical protein
MCTGGASTPARDSPHPLAPGPAGGRSHLRPQQGGDAAPAEGRVHRQRHGRRAARRRRQARHPADRRPRRARGARPSSGRRTPPSPGRRTSCARSSTISSAASPSSKRTAVARRRRAARARCATPSANFLEPGQALLTTSWFWGPYQTLCDEADRKLETVRDVPTADGGLDVGASTPPSGASSQRRSAPSSSSTIPATTRPATR